MKRNSWAVWILVICFGCTFSWFPAAADDSTSGASQSAPGDSHQSRSNNKSPGEDLYNAQHPAPNDTPPDSYGLILDKIRTGEIAIQRKEDGNVQITVTTESSLRSVLNSISGNSKDWSLNGPWLIFCICAILCLGASLYLFYFKARNNILAFRITVLMVLSISSLILIVGGYAKEQIVPVIGFFSTIAGFLLGSKTDAANHNDDSGK